MRPTFILLLILFPLFVFSQESLEMLEQRMEAAQGEEQLKLMIELGKRYSTIDPDMGLELGLKAAFLSKRTGNQKYEGKALLLMGESSLNAAQQENALRYYNRALNHFEKYNDLKEQVIALEGISTIYNHVRNYNLAKKYLRRALTISKNLGNTNSQLNIRLRLGNIALNQDNYSEAYKEFIEALDIISKIDSLNEEQLQTKAQIFRHLGFVYRSQGQFDQSLSAYRKSADIQNSLNDKPSEYFDIQDIGFSHLLMNELDSALHHYNKVLAYYQLQNDSINMITLLQSIGDVFYEKQQYRQAVASYNRSLELAKKTNSIHEQISALVNISKCFNAFGDYPSSKDYLNSALEIATSKNLTTSAADVYRYLSHVYEEEGRFMQALDFYKQWAELRDSIYSEESGEKMARMQILYEITQRERENEILRQNSEIQNLQLTKTRYQRMVFIVLALFFFALLVLFAFFYKSKQKEFAKQKETEQRILDLNKELEKRMITEIKKQEKQQLLLAQKSKLESLGTLAAGIAHEINQPLGGISMGLDNILIRLSDENLSNNYLKEKVTLMFDSVDRIKKIIDHTRTFSRSHKPASFERINVNEVVGNALIMIEAQFTNHGVNLDKNLATQLELVIADKFKLEQVVLNLLSNAKFAVDEKEKRQESANYKKRISINTWEDDENAYITIQDNGIGIKKKDMEKIFDPFYTTKKEDKGTGLGLSISYGFIKDILGDIIVESEENEYTKFEVKIPKS